MLNPQMFNDAAGAVSDLFNFGALGEKEEALQFEQQNYDLASQLALQNEQYTKTSTAIKQQQQDRELYTSLGRTQAAIGGAGLASGGSGEDILRESAQQGATARAALGQQGLITEAGYQEQSEAYQNMAAAAQAAENEEKTAGIGDLIGAGLKGAAALATLFTGGLPGGEPGADPAAAA